MIARPGETVVITAEDAPTGLVGTIGVRILQGESVVLERFTAGIVEALAGSGIYATTITAPDEPGNYTVVWDTGGAEPVYGTESLRVVSTTADPNFLPLVTRDEVKTAEFVTSSSYDAAIDQLIPQVSAAIRRLTGREFGAIPETTTRTFEYRGGGVVDIADADSITSVRMDGVILSEGRDYRAQPQNRSEPYFYLDLYREPGPYGSPEMGFTRNEDSYSAPKSKPRPALVSVEGVFGWTAVPQDVKLAAIEMIRVVADFPKDDIQSEALAEYSYSNVPDQFNSGRWPTRAVDLLRPYKRINI